MNLIDVATGAKLISRGAVIAYPTEACFGIGCDPFNEIAVRRVVRIKNRPRGMGLILIADHVNKLLPFIELRQESIMDPAVASWPGPYTWIFPASKRMPISLRTPTQTVAVRVTAHPASAHLSRLAGCAIVSTSANRHGQMPIRAHREVARCLGESLDFVVRGPLGHQKNPTQITDAVSGKVLRAG